MRVIDGAHRLQAAREQGRATIAVKYFDGTDDDAFALAVQVNVSHGLPLSLAERKAAARRLVASHPLWSDRLIASVIGLSHKTVGVERRRSGGESTRLNSRVGRDGKVHRLTVSEGREVAVEIIRNNPAASLREISREAGISVGTAKSVRDRLTRPGYRAARPGPVGEQAAGCGGAAVPATDGSCAPIGHESPIKNQMVGPQHSAGTGNATSTQELILRTLRNDPALRFNDKGKVLLRRLALSFTDIHALQRHAAEAPGHTRLALAKLARANARSWLDLAARLDNGLDRARPDSDVDRTA
ncbi:hypothetical protein [Nocardia sp. NPDC050175]|uniref:hypothetical protein n=1 Tax=Nocardia sp. NPDC050175 TaxID=3364317 RepID=UPI0037A942A3